MPDIPTPHSLRFYFFGDHSYMTGRSAAAPQVAPAPAPGALPQVVLATPSGPGAGPSSPPPPSAPPPTPVKRDVGGVDVQLGTPASHTIVPVAGVHGRGRQGRARAAAAASPVGVASAAPVQGQATTPQGPAVPPAGQTPPPAAKRGRKRAATTAAESEHVQQQSEAEGASQQGEDQEGLVVVRVVSTHINSSGMTREPWRRGGALCMSCLPCSSRAQCLVPACVSCCDLLPCFTCTTAFWYERSI
jgi:hypothetical protein